MSDQEQVERMRFLVESLSDDQAERDRLKQRADESLARLHLAVQEFLEAGKLHRRHGPRVDQLF